MGETTIFIDEDTLMDEEIMDDMEAEDEDEGV